MRKKKTITPKITIKELLDEYPETAIAFIRKRMACVGCVGEEFHTLEEAAQCYAIDLRNLIAELESFLKKEHKNNT